MRDIDVHVSEIPGRSDLLGDAPLVLFSFLPDETNAVLFDYTLDELPEGLTGFFLHKLNPVFAAQDYDGQLLSFDDVHRVLSMPERCCCRSRRVPAWTVSERPSTRRSP